MELLILIACPGHVGIYRDIFLRQAHNLEHRNLAGIPGIRHRQIVSDRNGGNEPLVHELISLPLRRQGLFQSILRVNLVPSVAKATAGVAAASAPVTIVLSVVPVVRVFLFVTLLILLRLRRMFPITLASTWVWACS